MNNNYKEEKEDATKYGEFISSYFNWITLKDQKRIVDKLEDITKNKKGNQNDI